MLSIYTDGATFETNPSMLGSNAFVVVENDTILHEYSELIDELTTNNRMEILGVMNALRWLVLECCQDEVMLYSDSEYVVKGLNEWRFNWIKKNWRGVKNEDLWRELSKVFDRLPNAKIQWIKGHAGHKYNERADELCNLHFK